jgi:hypothetical protein
VALSRLIKVRKTMKHYFIFPVISSIYEFLIMSLFPFPLKDNIALIAVLEAKFGNHGAENPGKRQLLCVVRE